MQSLEISKAGKDGEIKSVEILYVHGDYKFAFISNKLKLYGVYCILTMEIMEIYHKCSSDNIPKYGNDKGFWNFFNYIPRI